MKVLEMNKNDFNIKATRLSDLSDSNSLYKTKPDLNPNVTKSYKKEMRKAVKEAYKDDKIKRDIMLENLDNMDPDHIWELQLGGLD